MLSINKRTIFLYFFLFTGVFNDVLRIPSTEVTLFRALLPFAVIISIYCSKKVKLLYVFFVILSLVSYVQSYVFCLINDEGIAFYPVHLVKFLFFYACLTVVIGSVIVIFEQSPLMFRESFLGFVVLNSLILLGLFIIRYHAKLGEDTILNNPNDYGAMLTMVLPFFYYCFSKYHKIIRILFISTVVVYAVLNDCRAAIFAMVIQVFVIIWVKSLRTVRGSGWIAIAGLCAILIAFVVSSLLSSSGFELNGQNWDDIIVEPIRRVLSGRASDNGSELNLFRTNATIACIGLVWKTKLLGIGAGNLGFLLRRVLEDFPANEQWIYQYDYVSPHNAFFEFLLEWGYVAVIGFGLIIREIVLAIRKDNKTDIDKCFIVISISSLLWMIGPSGILVDYFIFIVFTYLLIIVVNERKVGTRLNEDQV